MLVLKALMGAEHNVQLGLSIALPVLDPAATKTEDTAMKLTQLLIALPMTAMLTFAPAAFADRDHDRYESDRHHRNTHQRGHHDGREKHHHEYRKYHLTPRYIPRYGRHTYGYRTDRYGGYRHYYGHHPYHRYDGRHHHGYRYDRNSAYLGGVLSGAAIGLSLSEVGR